MFSKKVSPPTTPTDYPSGICVRTETGYYYINGKFRHPILGSRIRRSWHFPFIVVSTNAALVNYPRAARLGFRDGTLLRAVSDGHLYFIAQRLRRPVQSPEALSNLGLTSKDAIWISSEELNIHKLGEVLK